MYTPNCRKDKKNMIINEMIQEETYYENEWKEINGTVRHSSSGYGYPGGLRQRRWGDIRSRDSRPGNNRRNIRRGF